MPASESLIRRLHALRRRVTSQLNERVDREHIYKFDFVDTIEWFERWAKIRDELIATDPDMVDLKVRPLPTAMPSDDFFEGYISRDSLHRLWRDMEDATDVLLHPTRAGSGQVSIDREGIFTAGQPFDAMLATTAILKSAKTSIAIVDGYVSDRTLNLLAIKAPSVTTRLLTYSLDTPTHELAKAFHKQHGGLEVRTSKHFHDRFLIVDDADFYHFGHSIKDAAIKSTFMFSRIEEPSWVQVLRTDFSTEWAKATVLALA